MKCIIYTLSIFIITIGNALAVDLPFVYRGDMRNPDYIFANGFVSKGTNFNIIQHLIGGNRGGNNSGYVSTSESEFIAAALGSVHAEEDPLNPGYSEPYWVYQIVPEQNFYSIPASLNHLISTSWMNGFRDPNRNLIEAQLLIDVRDRYEDQREWAARGFIPNNRVVSATLIAAQGIFNTDGSIRTFRNFTRLGTIPNSSWDRQPSNPNLGFLDASIYNPENVEINYIAEINNLWVEDLNEMVNTLVPASYSPDGCINPRYASLASPICPAIHKIVIKGKEREKLFKTLIKSILYETLIPIN